MKYYEAAIPQYHINSVLLMLKTKQISVLQEFILKFVSAGINAVSEIKEFLGVNINVINSTVAKLQTLGMLSVDVFRSALKLTEKGELALREASMIVPEMVEYPIYMDGVTGIIYLSNRTNKYTQKQVRDFRLKAIIPCVEKPTMADLPYEEVKMAIASYRRIYSYARDHLEGELQEIQSIEKPYIEYNKVTVLVFMNKKNHDEIELQVYEGNTRNQDYEIALTRMLNNQVRVFDFDEKSEVDDSEDLPLMNMLPKEIVDNAREHATKSEDLEKEIEELQSQLEDVTISKKNAESIDTNGFAVQQEDEEEIEETREDDDYDAEEKIRFLEDRIEELRRQQSSSSRILSTYEHRDLLIKTLQNARKTVVIISPWIKAYALNDEIFNLLNGALSRKVRIIIGYGISEADDSDQYVIKKLDRLKEKYGELFVLRKLANTHEKVLIKDDDYMVVTSFNWLSFRGDPNRGFRQETGIYTEVKECISDMKKNLSGPQRLDVQL